MQRASAFIALTLVLLLAAPCVAPAADKGAKDEPSTADKVRDKVEGASGKLAGDAKNADRDPVKAAQTALKARGYDVDEPDGKLGPKTRAAVRKFQKDEGLKVTGRLDTETMERLKAGKHESRPSASPQTGPTKR
jgi:peptidoglycan hydrolase-like protein with peptidoglycan-binding domain